jgi:hypothetical protein
MRIADLWSPAFEIAAVIWRGALALSITESVITTVRNHVNTVHIQ